MLGRSLKILRPHPHEIPWQMLCLDACEHPCEDITRLMRIAKEDETVLGGYLLQAPVGESVDESRVWQLLRLGVAAPRRRQGLGYWLIGHATGVAESRGATEIRVQCQREHPAWRLFCRYGYAPVGIDQLRFLTYSE